MAEFTEIPVQTVAVGQNVLFTETPVTPEKCIWHREGSGLISLRGLVNNSCKKARFLVHFEGNLAIPTGQAVGEISVAIAIDGEPLEASRARATLGAVEAFFNASTTAFIEVPAGCCLTVSIENTSAIPIEVENANIIITRVN